MALSTAMLDKHFRNTFPKGSASKKDESLVKRVARAISWVKRAERYGSHDLNGKFISLWIAFNALYGRKKYSQDSSQYTKDREDMENWIQKICRMETKRLQNEDEEPLLITAVDDAIDSIKVLLSDIYLSDHYWRGKRLPAGLATEMQKEKAEALQLLENGYCFNVLKLLASRLSVLRNQIVHGCSTDIGSKNEESLRPAVSALSVLVPSFISVMILCGSQEEWDDLPYPPKGSWQHPW